MGGGHNDWPAVAQSMKDVILDELSGYDKRSTEDIIEERYQKFR